MEEKDVLPDDGRLVGSYKTRYPDVKCQKKIKRDACYITFLLLVSLVCMLLNFLGVFEAFFGNRFDLSEDRLIIFRKAMYCVISSLLGGATFGMKYFYRVVARGLWNEDRVYWRLFSPLIAISLSIVMSAIMIKDVSSSSSLAITIGFLTGYFSDEAVSKMYDIACVLFLKSESNVEKKKDEIDSKIEEGIKDDTVDNMQK